MYAPIFLAPAPAPSPAILAAERAILEREGPYHVEGRHYAKSGDADTQRRWAAERKVRESARRVEWRSRRQRHAARFAPVNDVSVSTWLTVRERERVDAARDPHPGSIHRDDLRSVRHDIAEGRADAALISAALLTTFEVPALTSLVRGFPASQVVGLVSDADATQALASALLFGRAGIQTIIDCRAAEGWSSLRHELSTRRVPDAFMRDALAAVLSDIAPSPNDLTPGCAAFFAAVFAPHVASSKEVAARLGIHPATLASRFYRAGLPSPKRFVAHARLLWVAHFAQTPGARCSAVAHRVGASSPQSLSRMIRSVTGLTAGQFRTVVDVNAMLTRFRETLTLPHRDTLRAFDPFSPSLRREATVSADGLGSRANENGGAC